MNPGKYLIAGATVVAILITGIVAQGWVASNHAAVQHQNLIRQQELQAALEELRASVNRLISSTNEAALISFAAKASGAQESGVASEAEADEREMIADATQRGTLAIELLLAKTSNNELSEYGKLVSGIDASFKALIASTEVFHKHVEEGQSGAEMLEAKEAQEEAEMALLEKIGSMSNEMRGDLTDGASNLTSDLQNAKIVDLLAGIVSGLLLLLVSIFLVRRINGMFRQINEQNSSIEAMNSNLSDALSQLKDMQASIVEREKFSTLGRLTATVSHELRNPLSAIRNVLFAIDQKMAGNDEIKRMAERGARSVARCDNIIADLLEYTKTRPLDKKPTDVGQMIINTMEEQMLPADVTCEITIPEEPVIAELDAFRFSRVIINLVENAGHAITVAKRPGLIRISCSEDADTVGITVQDNGGGIPDDIRPKIFDALFTTKNFGAGLGLSICKNLVQEHGGTIGVESTTGTGTTFMLSLPKISSTTPQSIAA
jgi:signal transduction histidine kinase